MFTISNDGKLELYKEPYATIECETEDDYNHIVKAIESMKDRREGDGPTSHSEKHIVAGCIALMEGVYQNILDFMGLENEDEAPQLSYTYFEIVQTLLLRGTTHGGGTSTREKCEKLGLDSYGGFTIGEIEQDLEE